MRAPLIGTVLLERELAERLAAIRAELERARRELDRWLEELDER